MGTAFRGETSPYAWVRVGSGAPPGVSASKGGGVRGPNSMGKTRSKPPETADPTPSAGSGVPWLLGPFSRVLGASGDSGGTASAWRGEGGRRGGGSLTCERGARRGRTGGRTGGRGTPVCGAGVSGQGARAGMRAAHQRGGGLGIRLLPPCLTPASPLPPDTPATQNRPLLPLTCTRGFVRDSRGAGKFFCGVWCRGLHCIGELCSTSHVRPRTTQRPRRSGPRRSRGVGRGVTPQDD